MVHLQSIAINLQMFSNNYHLYSIKSYIGITASMSLQLSTCVLFISLMQSVNGAKFLSATLSLFLFAKARWAAVSRPI